MNNKTILLIGLLLCFAFLGIAQENEDSTVAVSPKTQRNAWFQLGFASNAYKGDLQGYNKWTPSVQFGIIFNKKKRVNGEFNFNLGKLVGENPDYVFLGNPEANPNVYFQTNFINFNYQIHINLYKTETFKAYLFQGIGFINFNVKNEYNESFAQKRSTRAPNELYNNFSITLPHGIGVLYTLKNNFGFGLQTGFLNTRTDYLDNISAWGNRAKKDNVLFTKFQVLIPLQNVTKASEEVKTIRKARFSH
jgi:hypothetical protein